MEERIFFLLKKVMVEGEKKENHELFPVCDFVIILKTTFIILSVRTSNLPTWLTSCKINIGKAGALAY